MQATLTFPNDVIGTLTCHHRVLPHFGVIPRWFDMQLKVVCEGGEITVFNHIKPTNYHWIKVSVKTGKEGKSRKTRIEKAYKPNDPSKKGEEWWSRYVH